MKIELNACLRDVDFPYGLGNVDVGLTAKLSDLDDEERAALVAARQSRSIFPVTITIPEPEQPPEPMLFEPHPELGKFSIWIAHIINSAGMSKSSSESMRLVNDGKVKLNGVVLGPESKQLRLLSGNFYELTVGTKTPRTVVVRVQTPQGPRWDGVAR